MSGLQKQLLHVCNRPSLQFTDHAVAPLLSHHNRLGAILARAQPRASKSTSFVFIMQFPWKQKDKRWIPNPTIPLLYSRPEYLDADIQNTKNISMSQHSGLLTCVEKQLVASGAVPGIWCFDCCSYLLGDILILVVMWISESVSGSLSAHSAMSFTYSRQLMLVYCICKSVNLIICKFQIDHFLGNNFGNHSVVYRSI